MVTIALLLKPWATVVVTMAGLLAPFAGREILETAMVLVPAIVIVPVANPVCAEASVYEMVFASILVIPALITLYALGDAPVTVTVSPVTNG